MPSISAARSKVFSRRDQLSLRSGQKDENKEKKTNRRNAKKNTEGEDENEKKTEKGRKGKGAKEATSEKKDGKMAPSRSSSSKPAATANEGSRKRKSSDACETEPKNAKEPKKSPKNEKSPTSDQKPKKAKKAMAETEIDVNQFWHQQEDITSWVNEHVDWSSDLETLKDQVKAARVKFGFFRLNIYWSRPACGLTLRSNEGNHDVAYFKFDDEATQRAAVVAIACAECAATRPNIVMNHS